MRLRFLLILAALMLAACGGGGEGASAFVPRVNVTANPATARVSVDNVVARADFSPGRESFGPGASLAWTFASKPPGSSATLQPTSTNPQDAATVTFAPDVSGTYALQVTVNYGAGLPVAVGTASVTAVHAMYFSVDTNAFDLLLTPDVDLTAYAVVTSDAPIASVEAFLDGRSLGVLSATNTTPVCTAMHATPCPPARAYGFAIPRAQLAGTHTLRWAVAGAVGTGIAGEGTVQIGQSGLINTGPQFNFFGPFAGNP